MNLLSGLIGGFIGGLIGAAIWTAVGYSTNYEVGFIAWGIGAIVGVGVNIGMKQSGGPAGAAIAVVLSIAAIAGGKWAVIHFQVQEFMSGEEASISTIADIIVAEKQEQGEDVYMPPETMEFDSYQEMYPANIWAEANSRWSSLSDREQEDIKNYPMLADSNFYFVYMADEIITDRYDQGKQVDWPEDYDIVTAWRQAHYPVDVWEEVGVRWNNMSTQEQVEYQKLVRAYLKNEKEEAESEITSIGFKDSFSLFDILWVILAVGTAAKIGAGGECEGDE